MAIFLKQPIIMLMGLITEMIFIFISLLAQQKLQHVQIGLITLLWIPDVTYALLYQIYI